MNIYRYAVLAADAAKANADPKKASEAMIQAMYKKEWLKGDEGQIGTTKVKINLIKIKCISKSK